MISLAGVVRTTTGAPVAHANVTVVAMAHQDRVTGLTAADGQFTIASVPPGPYIVTVQLPGRPPTAPSALNLGGSLSCSQSLTKTS